MSPIPLGIFASSGGVAGATYELIGSATVGAGGTGVITFSGLSAYASTYKHFQIRYVARGTYSYTNSFNFLIRFNGIATTSYWAQAPYILNGNNTIGSNTSGSTTYVYGGYYAGSGVAANTFGAGIVDIYDAFSTNKIKTARSISSQPANSVGLTVGFWNDTAAINQIEILEAVYGPGGKFVEGSRFSLYGIRDS